MSAGLRHPWSNRILWYAPWLTDPRSVLRQRRGGRPGMGRLAGAGGIVGGEHPGGIGGSLPGLGPGSRIAGYLLEEQVGVGGMAVVFRARDERLDRLVALKILAPALAADEAFRQRFIRESRAAAAVDDPHIIPVHEAGEANGVLFIAMRYVPGGDVGALMHREHPLSPARVVAIISPMASALDAAHAAGLVHRDVKPKNMLVDAHPGRPDHVYLSDFGVSKGAMSSAGLTGSGQYLGTPGYIAPEQIQGKPLDGRADQYALACTAFQLLCGETPFERDQGLAVIYAHLSEPPPDLTSRRPDLPPAVNGVLARALAKVPGDRYATCRQFADALRLSFGLAPYDSGPGRIPDPGRIPPVSHPPTQTAWRAGPGMANEDAGVAAAVAGAAYNQPTDQATTAPAPAMQHQAQYARASRPASPAGSGTLESGVAAGSSTMPSARPRRSVTRYAALAVALVAVLVVAFVALGSGSHSPAVGSAPATPADTAPQTTKPASPKPSPAESSPASPTDETPTPAAVQSGTWSGGQLIDDGNSLTSASCPTARFCMAGDSGGNVYTYSGGTWSAARQIDSNEGLTSVSCPTASFCAATSSGPDVYIDSDGSWSDSQLVGADGNPANLTSVSCPAAGFCFATGDWDTYRYSGGKWAGGHVVQNVNTLASISCPTAHFCMTDDSGGNVYTY
jgi:serine/threonine protein kinase